MSTGWFSCARVLKNLSDEASLALVGLRRSVLSDVAKLSTTGFRFENHSPVIHIIGSRLIVVGGLLYYRTHDQHDQQ
jgi:hypothetical protein